jgi:hypothetical protein
MHPSCVTLPCLFSTRVAVKFALDVGRLRYCAITKDSGLLCYFKPQEDAKPAGHSSLPCMACKCFKFAVFLSYLTLLQAQSSYKALSQLRPLVRVRVRSSGSMLQRRVRSELTNSSPGGPACAVL